MMAVMQVRIMLKRLKSLKMLKKKKRARLAMVILTQITMMRRTKTKSNFPKKKKKNSYVSVCSV